METRTKLRRELRSDNPLRWASLVLGAVALCACGVELRDPFQSQASAGATASTTQPTAQAIGEDLAPPTVDPALTSGDMIILPELETLEGWLSIVWNDSPHFFLTDDAGQTVEILLHDELTAPLGGPLALDRSRVIVLAMVSQEVPEAFEAVSITLEEGG